MHKCSVVKNTSALGNGPGFNFGDSVSNFHIMKPVRRKNACNHYYYMDHPVVFTSRKQIDMWVY